MSSLTLILRTSGLTTTRRVLTPTTISKATTRSYTMARKVPVPSFLPPIDSVAPPSYFKGIEEKTPDPDAAPNNPITSAHAIDLTPGSEALSTSDCATITPSGTITHGRYGELSPSLAEYLPLEYLALLHPAAEGAAALRLLGAEKDGTVLVFGASQPGGMAALQLATARGLAAVGVVGGEHSGHGAFVDSVKSLTSEPGFVVPEEYAILKKPFQNLVEDCVSGEKEPVYDPSEALEDFKENLKGYIEMFPSSMPAAVDKDALTFRGKSRDRKYWKENMEAYLEQFGGQAQPISDTELQQFTMEQYEVYKRKLHELTTSRITAGSEDATLHPTDTVKQMCAIPETVEEVQIPEEEVFPYRFSPLRKDFGNFLQVKKGGPIAGAIIAVTPYLKAACEAVNKAKTLRDKAEALQFLPDAEKNAFDGARSVAHIAEKAGKSVLVVGGELPGFSSVNVTDADVETALKAMDIEEGKEKSDLNYFIQVYKAGDFPFYEDYAVHRAMEPLSGPRQIVVTK